MSCVWCGKTTKIYLHMLHTNVVVDIESIATWNQYTSVTIVEVELFIICFLLSSKTIVDDLLPYMERSGLSPISSI